MPTINKIGSLINSQVDINRAVFAHNDARNGNKLKLTPEERKKYLVSHAKEAIASLREFVKANPIHDKQKTTPDRGTETI